MLILFISIYLFIFSLYMFIRNMWVYEVRMKLNRFENGVHLITLYLDYNEMLWKFWVWDVEKLRRSGK